MSFVRSVLAGIIATILGGIVVSYLTYTGSAWVTPVLNGILATLMLAAIYTLIRLPNWSRVSTRNIEQRVRTWVDNFGLGVQRADLNETHFTLVLTLKNGGHVVVSRHKDRERYLTLQSDLTLSKEHRDVFDTFRAIDK